MDELSAQIRDAIRHFWKTRQSQSERQGTTSGVRDSSARSAVTGGAQLDGFVELVRRTMQKSGVREAHIHCKRQIEIPGWFRPEKCWDLLVVRDGTLLAAIEFKSHIGPSFGNNYNNRTEEALGSATDVLAAYREGAFKPSARPWLGYLMLLEESPKSMSPIRAKEPHFKVFAEFKNSSYAKRYEILLTKLLRDRLYDGCCLLLSNQIDGLEGGYREPSPELSFAVLLQSLLAKVLAATITPS